MGSGNSKGTVNNQLKHTRSQSGCKKKNETRRSRTAGGTAVESISSADTIRSIRDPEHFEYVERLMTERLVRTLTRQESTSCHLWSGVAMFDTVRSVHFVCECVCESTFPTHTHTLGSTMTGTI